MKSVLFVMDIQQDFVGEGARMPVAKHQVEQLITNTNAAITQAEIHRIPIFYIRNEFEKEQWLSNWFRNHAAIKGTEGALLDPRLKVVNSFGYAKKQSNALSNLALLQHLQKLGTEHLYIAGLFAEGCVSSTAWNAMTKGLLVSVIQNAVAGANESKLQSALKRLEHRGVRLLHAKRVS
ncbi:cysteine hydrolase family protein [Paenibacillus sp. 2TAB23]|uniref:cysteine hydrolase family protein n=1 Tax=Paenibacillus sp. 2TAB23 TaxID=3233004 RepID=UPI003F9DCE9B